MGAHSTLITSIFIGDIIHTERIKLEKILHLNGNGEGENVLLKVDFKVVGDRFYTNQELSVSSYCTRTTISLINKQFTPKNLRRWADELEQHMKEFQSIAEITCL